MDLLQRVEQHFLDSITARQALAAELTPPIAAATQHIVQTLIAGGKLLVCGSGNSAKEAQYFVSKMLGCFERERPSLPAIALTAEVSISSSEADYNESHRIFARQIYALARPNDTLLAMCLRGHVEPIISAVHAAHDCQMRVIALTGQSEGEIAQILTQEDTQIDVSLESMSRVQEMHITIIHALCDAVDFILLGGK